MSLLLFLLGSMSKWQPWECGGSVSFFLSVMSVMAKILFSVQDFYKTCHLKNVLQIFLWGFTANFQTQNNKAKRAGTSGNKTNQERQSRNKTKQEQCQLGTVPPSNEDNQEQCHLATKTSRNETIQERFSTRKSNQGKFLDTGFHQLFL